MKISLKKKKLTSGKLSLYIEYYKGSHIDNNGVKKHNRDFEYLKMYLHGDPKSPKEKRDNKETLALAENILALRQADVIKGKYEIKNTSKTKTPFLAYYNKLKEDRYDSKGNYDNWDAALKHIQAYCSPSITFNEVTEDFVKGFRRYLDKEANTKSGTPLSQNSKYTYFNKFKASLRSAYEEGYLNTCLLYTSPSPRDRG